MSLLTPDIIERGRKLLAGRRKHPVQRHFNAWLQAEGLDQGQWWEYAS
jgi:hypothetical protein